MMLLRRCQPLIRSFVRRSHLYIDQYDLSSTGIPFDEFRQRRERLVHLIRNQLQRKQKSTSYDFTLCLPSATRLYMGPDVAYFPFKQQSDFYYLTGCMQPNALLLFHGNSEAFSTTLFLSACSMSSIDAYQRWFGPIITDEDQICEMFGLDRVQSLENLHSFRPPSSSSVLFYDPNSLPEFSTTRKHLGSFLERFSASATFEQLQVFLHALRSLKSLSEQAILRQACQLTSRAFIQTMKIHPTQIDNEALIKARFQYECEKSGSMFMAFHPVVAAHGRSNILHYQTNDQPILPDDLVMLDAGGILKQYASDITRLWPISGRFTTHQRQLYEILLTVQRHLIDHLNSRQQEISRGELNTLADQYMLKYLREESILSRTLSDAQESSIIKHLCPTSASHHLGLDVHDCESVFFDEPLQPSNVITIEPGLYIPWDCPDVPPIYRGFATRIEDDVLVTKDGCEVLTKTCPKEVDDLHRLLDERIGSDEVAGKNAIV